MDSISERTGRYCMWLVIIILVMIVFEVVSRRLFAEPHKWAYEVICIFYAYHFLILAAYTLLHKGHVSIDILYLRLPPRGQAIVSIITYLMFAFPFLYVLFTVGIASAARSWGIAERTEIGLPLVYPLLRTAVPLASALLLLAALSDTIKNIIFAVKGERI